MSNLVLRISPPTIFPFSSSSAHVVSHSPLPGWVSQTSPGLVERTRGCHCSVLSILFFRPSSIKDPAITIKACCGRNSMMTALASSNVPISGSKRYLVVMSNGGWLTK